VTVVRNQAPVANNSSVSGASGSQIYCSLSYSHADQGQTLTFSIVGQPAHGRAWVPYPNSAYAYYTSDPGFVGGDSFTWKVNDGIDDSNIATVTVTVTASPPVPQNQQACVVKNTTNDIPPLYSGGGGYTYNVVKVSNPSHGTMVVTNELFRYAPAAGYIGYDSFTWRMIYDGTNQTGVATCTVYVAESSDSDWPQWRCNGHRNAMTPMGLPSQLYLRWRRDYRPHVRAWASGEASLYEKGYEPVVIGKTMIVGSSRSDWVRALDTETGEERWCYFTDGPVRVAPAVYSNRVYVASDDGNLYCLDVNSGALLMKKPLKPSERKCWGNGRVISVWPARGGPLLADGKLYIFSGIWASEGTFAWCLDAATGAEIWYNDSYCGVKSYQPHSHVGPGGPPPIGCLTLSTDRQKIFLGTGNGMPASFDRATGAFRTWPQTINASSGGGQGGPFVDPNWNESSTASVLYDLPVIAVAGTRAYTSTDVSTLGVSGTPTSILAADGKLFVVTAQGSIYCFAGSNSPPYIYPVQTAPLSPSDVWTTRVQTMLSVEGMVEGGVYALGLGSGRFAEEFVIRTDGRANKPKIVAVDPDEDKVTAFRNRLEAEGYYGTRIAALAGDPLGSGLPLYCGRLVLVEDARSAGYEAGVEFVEKLYELIRPYGGAAWLFISEAEHSEFAGWVAGSTNLPGALVSRQGEFTVLRRIGPLPGAVDYDPGYPSINSTNYDRALKAGPFGVQWFDYAGVPRGYVIRGTVYGGYDVYTGMRISDTSVPSGWHMSDASFNSWSSTNPLTGLVETRYTWKGYGCGRHSDFGSLETGRNGCLGWFDKRYDSGTIHWTGIRTTCEGGGSVMPGDGVLVAYGPGCGCDYPVRASVGLISQPGTENWAIWGGERNQRVIEDVPVVRVGLNFGAPGDRMAPDGTLWMECPRKIGPKPIIPVTFNPTNPPRVEYHFSGSRIKWDAGEKPWVSSSAIGGVSNITVWLAYGGVALKTEEPVTVDGELTDPCWDGRAGIQLVLAWYDVLDYPANQAWVRYDETNLYWGMKASAETWNAGGENRRWGVRIADRTVVTNVVHFEVYLDGRLKVNGQDPTNNWTSEWFGVTKRDADSFRSEIALPWATLAAAGINTNRDQLIFDVHGDVDHPSWAHLFVRNWQGGRYVPLYFDSPGGAMGTPRQCTVKLYFAELAGKAEGERVFDVWLQGQKVLTGLDIARVAGGTDRGISFLFSGVVVSGRLDVALSPVVGETVISGLEVLPGGNLTPPRIVSDSKLVVRVGESMKYAIIADGSMPISYGATGLPPGISVTGNLISGVPMQVGVSMVTLMATNSAGVATKTLELKVVAEWDNDEDGMPDEWEIAHRLNPKFKWDANLDYDGDGLSNRAEYMAGTDPRDSRSTLKIKDMLIGADGKALIKFDSSINGRWYNVEYNTNLLYPNNWQVITDWFWGSGQTFEVVDPLPGTKRFYRLKARTQ
jgi:outer membrane protein assembly factor BamB